MKLELEGVVDADGRLTLDIPIPLDPGRVRVTVDTAEVDDEEEVWRAFLAHAWRDVGNDPAEDIYTLADGKPIDPKTGEVIDETR